MIHHSEEAPTGTPILYTTRALTKILHLSEARIRHLIHRGGLKGIRIGVELCAFGNGV